MAADILPRMRTDMATLVNALVEERAYNIGIRTHGILGHAELIRRAKDELHAEYPGVEF